MRSVFRAPGEVVDGTLRRKGKKISHFSYVEERERRTKAVSLYAPVWTASHIRMASGIFSLRDGIEGQHANPRNLRVVSYAVVPVAGAHVSRA